MDNGSSQPFEANDFSEDKTQTTEEKSNPQITTEQNYNSSISNTHNSATHALSIEFFISHT